MPSATSISRQSAAQYHFQIIERLQNVTTTIYGKVHFWNDEKHWRFIRRNDYRPGDKDDFCHISALEAAGIRSLEQGDEVSYQLMLDKRHPERLIVANLQLC